MATEDAIKKDEVNFILDLKILIAKSATEAESNRVRDARRRGEKNTASKTYRPAFEKLWNKQGLTFNEDRVVVPTRKPNWFSGKLCQKTWMENTKF